MRKGLPGALAALVLFGAVTAAMAASTEADFKSAMAAAEAADKDAAALKNQWTTTAQSMAAARKAAAAGDYDDAVDAARHAEALAKASIAQAKEQQEAWRAAIIR
jgi:hypothetical protein